MPRLEQRKDSCSRGNWSRMRLYELKVAELQGMGYTNPLDKWFHPMPQMPNL